ncbi:MAG TPA: alpha,alpha-trehalase TreF [Saprospiraceae bacterium]|nr:alpha,alpha-trehalase TreF [Saprospiraceae bacterium]HMQ82165.1 alpha,alpha-trehalase TreF [Saprospiraceae bacterium]
MQPTFLSPEARFGSLFIDVQMTRLFPDGKTFADCTPLMPADEIMARYDASKDQPGFVLADFVREHFALPASFSTDFQADTSRPVSDHINGLWTILTRQADDARNDGSLISLPEPYIVPGGRFGEIYYWDSYFTMLGLAVAGRVDMIEHMINNFAYLIDAIGFIPNGNRTYFLSRSQPPFFAQMVNLLAELKGNSVLTQYLPQLEKEYRFWMEGKDKLQVPGTAEKHVVLLSETQVLHRYWDAGDTPRAEMYRDDVETAEATNRNAPDLYRAIRAACESGWDFSCRWMADGQALQSIHTTDIIPVDLNALLYGLEKTLQKAYQLANNPEKATQMGQWAQDRQAALLQYCWDPKAGFFMDYDFKKGACTPIYSLAGLFPLYFQLADEGQAKAVANQVAKLFLREGGVVSTPYNTGQQWDAPNGWAPLQWITLQGLRHYGHTELADTIKQRWIDLNTRVYQRTGKMLEKYNVEDMSLEAGGGEYPVQDGFGWSNGVLLKLLME